jgi:hypothetical protein
LQDVSSRSVPKSCLPCQPRRGHHPGVTKLVVAILLFVGCGTNPTPAGGVCTKTSDCDSNLTCLDVAQVSGPNCTVIGQACSITCTTDDSVCASLGSNFMCFTGCGADKFCGEVANP